MSELGVLSLAKVVRRWHVRWHLFVVAVVVCAILDRGSRVGLLSFSRVFSFVLTLFEECFVTFSEDFSACESESEVVYLVCCCCSQLHGSLAFRGSEDVARLEVVSRIAHF